MGGLPLPKNKINNNQTKKPSARAIKSGRKKMRYNYLESVKEDVKNYIKENRIFCYRGNIQELSEKLNDELWTNDNVTGNGSGSYTFSAWQAEENLCHNLDLLREALEEFGNEISILESPEACDVTIRCYLLGSAIADALNEMAEETTPRMIMRRYRRRLVSC